MFRVCEVTRREFGMTGAHNSRVNSKYLSKETHHAIWMKNKYLEPCLHMLMS